MMKKSIALFSTLLILVLVIMLMSISLKNSTNIKVSNLKDRYLIQENISISDIKDLLVKKISPSIKNITDPKQKAEILKKLFSAPFTIEDSINKATIEIKLSSNNGKININFITSDLKNYITSVFSNLGVLESEVLRDIVLANITGGEKYKDEHKLFIKDLDKQAGYITSKEIFLSMVDLYAKETNDFNALNIDYEKVFSFEVLSKQYNRSADNKLDINYLDIILINALPNVHLDGDIKTNINKKNIIFYEISQLNLDTDIDDSDEKSEKTRVEDAGIGFETEDTICEINIKSINYSVKYIFNYNLKNNKISNIRINRWIY